MADNGAQPPIATDRPSTTASSIVVPLGSLQFENGFADTVSQGLSTLDGPETLARFGLLSKTELRLTVPNYFGVVTSGAGGSSGFGDLSVGMKQQLGPVHGFDVSLIFTLSLPTGAHAFSSHGYDPSLQLPWSRSVSSNWTVAGMFSTYWPTQEGRHNFTGETTFLIDRQVRKGFDGFVEYQGDFPQRGGPRNLVHFGATWKVTPRQQVDFHAGVGLSSAAPDHFFGFGYSFRFQAFHRYGQRLPISKAEPLGESGLAVRFLEATALASFHRQPYACRRLRWHRQSCQRPCLCSESLRARPS